MYNLIIICDNKPKYICKYILYNKSDNNKTEKGRGKQKPEKYKARH